MKETELAGPVAEWMEKQGFTVWSEVPFHGSMDLAGRNEKNELIMVELKTSFSYSLLRQCWRRLGMLDLVDAAAPSSPSEDNLRRFTRRGIGVLRVRGGTVEVLNEPSCELDILWARDKIHRALDRLSPGVYGGQAVVKGEGPARRVRKAVREYRREHPDAGWRRIWLDVSNHYSSPESMASAMRKVDEREEINRREQMSKQKYEVK